MLSPYTSPKSRGIVQLKDVKNKNMTILEAAQTRQNIKVTGD
jgi:hypothetical protein